MGKTAHPCGARLSACRRLSSRRSSDANNSCVPHRHRRASWRESLSALVDSGVPHASVYMLEVDEDSRLGREMLSGGARYYAGLVPTDDTMGQMYKIGRAHV